MARLRRLELVLVLGAAVAIAAPGCSTPADPKSVVVFVDVSGSVRDFGVYQDAWGKVVARLRGGDRIVLGRITDETYTTFRPVLEREISAFDSFRDNKLVYEKQAKALRQEIAGAFAEALRSRRSPRTDVMNTLNLAAKIFDGDKRRRVLVLLSDMLEDSETYNFEQTAISEAFIRKAVQARRRRDQVPDLAGAVVYVAGASGRTAGKAQAVERFWSAYLKAAKAESRHYGPALVNFGE